MSAPAADGRAAGLPHAALRVLLVEDSIEDAELILRALRGLNGPLEPLRVQDEPGLRMALGTFAPQLILSDFAMPGFDGLSALKIAREMAPHVPFIFVSGTIGEELAIEALHRGAADYVLKENLVRLPTAVRRVLDAADEQARRRAAEDALRESEERFRAIVVTTEEWIWEIDLEGRVRYSNDGVERKLGWRAGDVLGRHVFAFMHPEDRDAEMGRLPVLAAEGRGWNGRVLRWLHRDGSVRWLESNAAPRHDAEGRLTGFCGAHRDVTERVQNEAMMARLGRINAFLAAIGELSVRVTDEDELLEGACEAAVAHGFDAAWLGVLDGVAAIAAAPGVLRLRAAAGAEGAVTAIRESLGDGLQPGESRLLRNALIERRSYSIDNLDGDAVGPGSRALAQRAEVSAAFVLPLGRDPWGVLVLYSREPQHFSTDETALLDRLAVTIDQARMLLAKSAELEYLAFHSVATGLPNRVAFRASMAARLADGPMLVAALRLVAFYDYVSSRGREFAEAMLGAFGRRLRQLLPDDALIAHLGEQNFALGFALDASADEAAQLRWLDAVLREVSVEVDGEAVHVSSRIGIAMSPQHGDDPVTLERNAESALSETIRLKHQVGVYEHRFRERVDAWIGLERDLRGALARQEFELWFQPKYRVHGQQLCGAEALVRWRHPARGMVAPGEFIPVIEQTGMIVPLGEWVRETAMSHAVQWRERGMEGLRIAVNVSSLELKQPDFVGRCLRLMSPQAGKQCLDLELTESLIMEDVPQSIAVLEQLRACGARVAIDDFGTGYSSLNYLTRLPVDELKIDRSFISALAQSADAMSMVSNVIQLAHSLGLTVVAEGVEDEEQAKLLRLLRCDQMQGFLLGRPMPAAAFEQLLFG